MTTGGRNSIEYSSPQQAIAVRSIQNETPQLYLDVIGELAADKALTEGWKALYSFHLL